ncbi:hypothetical protein G3I59_18910 [Amycolatopsis rubida]|uniref:ParB/Sulfiredoxin domain-containing protein n=1 Tax=Amycolatopsis rubida TaxID=112413 RepID=A0ABX0BPT2_9PSEU|nr:MULTISPECIES: hypothetical protein [Amycolatopsis]MYW92621.1 hypothetical protein [Amycolatopsis rubida]NEC57606.1 hypothetical protein [Amycolatopsis rubida]OAP26260.1 hypothetical protein A4R44_02247 [Amycolatopsis sp. M39]
MKEHWKDEPDEHDYPAAFDYLTLVAPEDTAAGLVDQLKDAKLTHRKAKDILRASRLKLLPEDNAHVAKDLEKVKGGKALSPVLLVRGHGHPGFETVDDLVIADGYHRVCASYYLDENADIPCKLM